ncbi:MAG: hypothetical protein WA071_23515 [Undibacterium umbellatum]|uniref:hypothetical protein n=1 Tax=Undibacterium umbellatum TaxID=2762300 RepID=UPI003BB60343
MLQVKKWEMPETRFAQTTVIFFPFFASQQRHRHIGTAKIKGNPKVKSNVNVTEIQIALNLAAGLPPACNLERRVLVFEIPKS